MIQSILSVRHTSSDFTFVVAVVDVKTKSRLVKFSSVIFSVFFLHILTQCCPMFSSCTIPKTTFLLNKRLLRRQSMILSRPTTICQKTTEGRYKYTRATQKPFHIIQHIQFKCREVYQLFNVNDIQWSDSDCYI